VSANATHFPAHFMGINSALDTDLSGWADTSVTRAQQLSIDLL
jgi:hypothetical protein